MQLTRHQSPAGPRWAFNDRFLPTSLNLELVLELPQRQMLSSLEALVTDEAAHGERLAPLEDKHEVWACGVTYLRSRDARKEESEVADVYELVYEAARPEIFFKSLGWRAVGDGANIRVREDSSWNVPEPELTLVINAHGEIIGYTIGNDVSSRAIEGENPLYLPQAKMYDGACALGPAIVLSDSQSMRSLDIQLEISREGQVVFEAQASVSQMKRSFEELRDYLRREMRFPHGVFVMTGTSLVPPDSFTLTSGDSVTINIGELNLHNPVA